jgi:hypothetical protein
LGVSRAGPEKSAHRVIGSGLPMRQDRHQPISRVRALAHVERQDGDADSTEGEIQMNTRIAENYPEDYIRSRDLRTSAQLPGSRAYAGVREQFVGSDRIAAAPQCNPGSRKVRASFPDRGGPGVWNPGALAP